jgi:predicted protein tyrosine phosphatase
MTFRAPVIQNDLFEGIMSKNEFLEYQAELSLEDRANVVLISISEPDNSEYVSDNKVNVIGFHDVLEMKFWDVEKPIGKYTPLTDKQGEEIRKFITTNKDKKFLIHCKAGQSRSAGIGLAVECIVNFDGSVYDYKTGKTDIYDYERYSPNLTVFDAICSNDELKYNKNI